MRSSLGAVEIPWTRFETATAHGFGVLQLHERGVGAHEVHAVFDSGEELRGFCRYCDEAKARYAGRAPSANDHAE